MTLKIILLILKIDVISIIIHITTRLQQTAIVTMNKAVAILLLSKTVILAYNLDVINVKPVANKRLDVTPQDVVTRSSKVKCAATCRVTAWCVSANLAPDRSTCQLLSEEVSDETSLESADGWSYIRKTVEFTRE